MLYVTLVMLHLHMLDHVSQFLAWLAINWDTPDTVGTFLWSERLPRPQMLTKKRCFPCFPGIVRILAKRFQFWFTSCSLRRGSSFRSWTSRKVSFKIPSLHGRWQVGQLWLQRCPLRVAGLKEIVTGFDELHNLHKHYVSIHILIYIINYNYIYTVCIYIYIQCIYIYIYIQCTSVYDNFPDPPINTRDYQKVFGQDQECLRTYKSILSVKCTKSGEDYHCLGKTTYFIVQLPRECQRIILFPLPQIHRLHTYWRLLLLTFSLWLLWSILDCIKFQHASGHKYAS